MQWRNDSRAYGLLSIAMHWLMLLLLVAVYACIELRVLFDNDSPPREALKSWHFTLGLTVWVLVWLRLAFRLGRPRPLIVPSPRAWQLTMAQLMHAALYGLMLAMPLLGWLMFNANDASPRWLRVELPRLIAPDEALGARIKSIHVNIGKAGYALIGLHTAVALTHHYVMRDNTLRRMWPGGHTDAPTGAPS